jgi:predicted ferric reductase
MTEPALFSWLLWIVIGAWSGALIAALAFPVINTWRTEHRLHAVGMALMAVIGLFVAAGIWLDTTAPRWLLLASAALGIVLIAVPTIRLERD